MIIQQPQLLAALPSHDQLEAASNSTSAPPPPPAPASPLPPPADAISLQAPSQAISRSALHFTVPHCMRIHKTLTSVLQVITQLEPAALSIDVQTHECASAQSPIPFSAGDLKAGKQRLRQPKSVTFAPLPTPWRHGAHPSMLLLVHA